MVCPVSRRMCCDLAGVPFNARTHLGGSYGTVSYETSATLWHVCVSVSDTKPEFLYELVSLARRQAACIESPQDTAANYSFVSPTFGEWPPWYVEPARGLLARATRGTGVVEG